MDSPQALTFSLKPHHTLRIVGPKVYIYSHSKKHKGNRLCTWLDHEGYLKVKFQNSSVHVHRLVARAAFGECPPGLVVNHKDGHKLNNHPDNLEYCTIAENIKHSIEMGLHICTTPEKLAAYKDGRTRNPMYKHNWYMRNRDRILLKHKNDYRTKKEAMLNGKS